MSDPKTVRIKTKLAGALSHIVPDDVPDPEMECLQRLRVDVHVVAAFGIDQEVRHLPHHLHDPIALVRGAPVLRLEATHPETVVDADTAPVLTFTEVEMAALKDFMAPKRMISRGLVTGEDGVLQARGGKELSDPGFVDALQKVIDHLEAIQRMVRPSGSKPGSQL